MTMKKITEANLIGYDHEGDPIWRTPLGNAICAIDANEATSFLRMSGEGEELLSTVAEYEDMFGKITPVQR